MAPPLAQKGGAILSFGPPLGQLANQQILSPTMAKDRANAFMVKKPQHTRFLYRTQLCTHLPLLELEKADPKKKLHDCAAISEDASIYKTGAELTIYITKILNSARFLGSESVVEKF